MVGASAALLSSRVTCLPHSAASREGGAIRTGLGGARWPRPSAPQRWRGARRTTCAAAPSAPEDDGSAGGGKGAVAGKPSSGFNVKSLLDKMFDNKPDTEGFVTYSQFRGYLDEMTVQKLHLYDGGKTGILEVAGVDENTSQLFSVTLPGDAMPEVMRLVHKSADPVARARSQFPGAVRCDLAVVDPAAAYPPVVGQTVVYMVPILGFWAFQKAVDLFAYMRGVGRFKKSQRKVAAEEFGASTATRIDPQAPAPTLTPTITTLEGDGAPVIPTVVADPRSVRYADVAGLEGPIAEFREIVSIMLGEPTFAEGGVRCPRGVLLEGPPGTGKTMLATAVANEAGLPFYAANGAEFVQMFSGVAAARVRDLFRKARADAPSIIFIDELDALARARSDTGGGDSGTAEREQGLLQLLVEMDGFRASGANVLVIGATNVKHALDAALLRPGRLDRVIPMGLPPLPARLRILQVHARNKQLPREGSPAYPQGDALLRWAAEATAGMSGADLENLLNEAAILSVRANTPAIGEQQLEAALDKMRLGTATSPLPPTASKRQLAAIEAGRAVVGTLMRHICPDILQVSVRPRGAKPSRTVTLAEEGGGRGRTRLGAWSDGVDMVTVLLAGRAAEQILCGGPAGVSLATARDLADAHLLATELVARTGRHPLFRLVPLESDAAAVDGRRAALDAESAALVSHAYAAALRLVASRLPAVSAIVDELMASETVFGSRIRQIVASYPAGRAVAGPLPPLADVAAGFSVAAARAETLTTYADLDWSLEHGALGDALARRYGQDAYGGNGTNSDDPGLGNELRTTFGSAAVL